MIEDFPTNAYDNYLRWDRGVAPDTASNIAESQSLLAEHRQSIQSRESDIEELKNLSDLVVSIQQLVELPVSSDTFVAVDIAAEEAIRQRLSTLAKALDFNVEQLQMQVSSESSSLLTKLRRAYNSIGSRKESFAVIHTQIAELCREQIEYRQSRLEQRNTADAVNRPKFLTAAKPTQDASVRFLSTDRVIPFSYQGKRVSVSLFDLFKADPRVLIQRFIDIEERTVDAVKSNPELATIDAYKWVKETKRRMKREGLDIFPTPMTEHILDTIKLAHSKRNGIFSYVLYGDAGTGKTRLGQLDDAARGREDVVINFDYYTGWDELVGHSAMTLNLEGTSSADRLSSAVARFEGVNGDQFGSAADSDFWRDMQNVFQNISSAKQKLYGSVEGYVAFFGREATDMSTPVELTDKNVLRFAFLDRLRAMRDLALLGQEADTPLASRWVEGAILKAIREKKVICFDELDKAGPHAIEGLLSFLSLKPGELWKFQGGEIQIPADFYCWGTSNSRAIGAVTGSEDMNRYLADRCEQIHLPAQPVKDSLMIASVLISDEQGSLLLTEEEQQNLIAAFSFVIPRLQAASLNMPVTNRVIRTFCSRLVTIDAVTNRTVRVLNNDGSPRGVAEALRMTIFEMKQLSMSPGDKNVILEILSSVSGLLGEGKITPVFAAEDFPNLDLAAIGRPSWQSAPEREKVDWSRRSAVLNSVHAQPLFQAIGELATDIPDIRPLVIRMLDANLAPNNLVDLARAALSAPSLKVRAQGCRNGVRLLPTGHGLTAQILTDESLIAGESTLHSKPLAPNATVLADQLGETVAVLSDEQVIILKHGQTLEDTQIDADRSITFVDPLGNYIVETRRGQLRIVPIKLSESKKTQTRFIQQDGVLVPQNVGDGQIERPSFYLDTDSAQVIQIADEVLLNNALVDVSQNGDYLLVTTGTGKHELIKVRALLEGNSQSARAVVGTSEWHSARFVGNNFVIGMDQTGQVLSTTTNPVNCLLLA